MSAQELATGPCPTRKWAEPSSTSGSGADSLEADNAGHFHITAHEHNSVLHRLPDGSFKTLVYDPGLLRPDTMSVAADGRLYATANRMLLDCGGGAFVRLGQAGMGPAMLDAVLLTHTHADHTADLPAVVLAAAMAGGRHP